MPHFAIAIEIDELMKLKIRGAYLAILLSVIALFLLKGAALSLLWYSVLFCVPGFFLTFLLNTEFTNLERFLFGFPLTFLFFFVALFLSFLGVPISSLTLFLIIFILPLLLAFSRRDKVKLKFNTNIRVNSDLIAALAILIIVVVGWGGLLKTDALPRTAAGAYYGSIASVKDHILNQGTFGVWESWEGLGWPLLTFEPIIYHLTVPTFNILNPGSSLTADFNLIFLMSVFLFALGTYALMRRFGFEGSFSVFPAGLLVLQGYHIRIGLMTGYSKSFFAFATFPLVILCAHLALKDRRYFIPLALTLAVTYHSHQHVGFYAAFLAAFYYLVTLASQKKLPKGGDIKYIAAAIAIFAALISFQLAPALLNLEYTSSFEYVHPDIRILSDLRGTGLPLSALGLAGIAMCLYRKRKLPTLLLLISCVLIFATYFIPGIGEPYSQLVDLEKLVILFHFALAVAIPGIFFEKRANVLIFLVLLLLVANMAFDANRTGKEYVSEQFQEGMIFADSISYIKNAKEDGRVMTYGIFPVVEHFMPILTGRLDIGDPNRMAQHTDIYDKKIHDVWTYSVPKNTSSTYLENFYRMSWTKFILLQACSPGGQDAAGFLNEVDAKLAFSEGQCGHVIETESGGYAEKVSPVAIRLGEKELYGIKGAYKVVGFSEELPTDAFRHTIESAGDIAIVPEPLILKSERVSHEEVRIVGDFKEGEWVLVKEEYFPRWRAFMNGKEVPTRMSNIGLILIGTTDGSEIELRAGTFFYEVILSGISVLVLLLVFIFGGAPWRRKKQ